MIIFSVIIPAHNEELYIRDCITSIKIAQSHIDKSVEIIVVLNRCTDKTKEIAEGLGARTIVEDTKNLGIIRNAGIQAAQGKIILTIDADSIMTKKSLEEIYMNLESGHYIGGGSAINFNRYSIPIRIQNILMQGTVNLTGLYAGMFWAYKTSFDQVGGFSTDDALGEDIELAKRLKRLGKSQGKKYTKLKTNFITTSTRKFDRYGDWLYLKLIIKHPGIIWKMLTRKDTSEISDKYFYEFNNENQGGKP